MANENLITTGTHLYGYKIVRHLGVIRGITLRSRSIFGNIAGGILSMFGGQNSIYIELCEKTRPEAFAYMIANANEIRANAIINVRYDANEVMQGIKEVLAYGTAVFVEKTT